MALEAGGPTNSHRAVLELLSTKIDIRGRDRLLLSPVCIARSTGYKDENHIAITCRELAELDLIESANVDGTYYRITWRGDGYLAGEVEIDASELEGGNE